MHHALKTSALGALALTLASALPLAAEEVTADTVLATVGGVDITVGHMIVARTTLPQQYQQLPDDQLFEGLLDQLIQQNALAQTLDTPTVATQRSIDNATSGLLAGEAIGLVAQEAVTQETVQAAYNARYAEAEPDTEYNAAHILVESEEEARAVIDALAEGSDFAQLAQEKSTGPSGPNGGALGWFSKGMMVPPFEEAVIALEVGVVSEPVQTQFGWHVVKLNETRLKDAPSLEEVQAEIAGELERAAVDAHLQATVEAADVTRTGIEVDPSVISNIDLVAN